MDQLTVAGSFLITIGHGAGPEVNLLVSATNPDGSPARLSLPRPDDPEAKWPITVFVGLSAMFGTAALACKITGIESVFLPPPGFFGLTVGIGYPDAPTLDTIGLSALGIIVDTGTARGHAVATSAGVAQIGHWWSDRQPDSPRR